MQVPKRESKDAEQVTCNKVEKKCKDSKTDKRVMNIVCQECSWEDRRSDHPQSLQRNQPFGLLWDH